MKFYWFARQPYFSIKENLKDIEDSKFSGVLLPYSSGSPDYFIKIARTIDIKSKIKYLIAIRPHTISPQYLAALCKSLWEISPNRLIINFIPGSISVDEQSIGGFVGEIDDFSPHDDRKKYLYRFVEIFKSLKFREMPEIAISGIAKGTFDAVDSYADYNIVPYEPYKKLGGLPPISKPIIISMCPFLYNTQDEIDKINKENIPQDILFVTKQEFIKILEDLKSDGIENILLFNYGEQDQMHKIFDFVKEYVK